MSLGRPATHVEQEVSEAINALPPITDSDAAPAVTRIVFARHAVATLVHARPNNELSAAPTFPMGPFASAGRLPQLLTLEAATRSGVTVPQVAGPNGLLGPAVATNERAPGLVGDAPSKVSASGGILDRGFRLAMACLPHVSWSGLGQRWNAASARFLYQASSGKTKYACAVHPQKGATPGRSFWAMLPAPSHGYTMPFLAKCQDRGCCFALCRHL